VTAALATGLALLLAAMVAGYAYPQGPAMGSGSPASRRRVPGWPGFLPYLVAAAGSVCLLAAGTGALAGERVVLGLDSLLGFGHTILAADLLTRAELHRIEEPADTGGEPGAPRPPHLGYTSDVVELVEEYLYRPLARPMMALVRTAKQLQSGRLDAYLAYMLIALIAILAVVTAWG
jgi:hydrogenase-4 component B